MAYYYNEYGQLVDDGMGMPSYNPPGGQPASSGGALQSVPGSPGPSNPALGSFEGFVSQYMTPAQLQAASGPVTQAPTNAWNANPQNSVPSSEYGWLNKEQQTLDANHASNLGTIQGLSDLSGQTGTQNNAAMQSIRDAIAAQGVQNGQYIAQSQGLSDQFTAAGNTANAFDWGNLGTYQSGLSGLNASTSSALGNLGSQYQSLMPQLTSSLAPNYLTSQAAQAYADPASIAAQNQALGFLGGAMNGSLNYTSQAAQAYADPNDVYNQRASADALQGIAGGSKDVDFARLPGTSELWQSAQGYGRGFDELYGAFQGSQDVHAGQEDPAAYAAAHEALNKYRGLTTPEVTSAEEFIYKQAQMKQEQDERANREAVQTDLRQRGLSGSGMEIGQGALASQQISQNRLLADLGAQKQAVDRSMQALAGQANLSSTLSGQANDIAEHNAANRLGALQQFAGLKTDALKTYTGLGADVETANKNRQATAQAQAQQAYAQLRAQGFSEEYARGQAADIASANNQRTQLQGGIAYGDLASTQRDQSFNESFKRGTAADATNQFNELNRIDVTKYNQDYAQKERDASWNRTTDYTTGVLRGNEDLSSNLTSSFNAGQKTNADTFGRTKDTLGFQDLVNGRQNTLAGDQTDRAIGADKTQIGLNGDTFNRGATVAGLSVGEGNNYTTGSLGVMDKQTGGIAATGASKTAAELAKEQWDHENSFRFGLGGDRGLLGGNLIPGLI